jgi:hypothetical protein
MSIALKFGKDSQGFNAYAPRPSDTKWSVELLNGTAENVTLPTDADFYTVSFRFQPGTTVWVDVSGTTAEVPVGNTIAVTTSEMNPAQIILAGGTEISMITGNDSADVSIVIWQGDGS